MASLTQTTISRDGQLSDFGTSHYSTMALAILASEKIMAEMCEPWRDWEQCKENKLVCRADDHTFFITLVE